MQLLVLTVLGAAIGVVANVSATRLRHRPFVLDVAVGIAAALASGVSFATLGATSVRTISVFGADPVGFYAVLAAAAGALIFFIALDALTQLGTGVSRRHVLVDLAVEFTNIAHRSHSLFRGVGLSVRSRHASPALAKSRTR